jgi:hypothetical protein
MKKIWLWEPRISLWEWNVLFSRFYLSILLLMIEAKAMTATTKQPRHKISDGIYPAHLEDYQPMQTKNGLRYQFIFKLDGLTAKDGSQVTLMRTTSPSLAPKSHRRVIVEALLRSKPSLANAKDLFGNPSAGFESVQPHDLIDTPCTLHIENQKNKMGAVFSNIETVFPRYQK